MVDMDETLWMAIGIESWLMPFGRPAVLGFEGSTQPNEDLQDEKTRTLFRGGLGRSRVFYTTVFSFACFD